MTLLELKRAIDLAIETNSHCESMAVRISTFKVGAAPATHTYLYLKDV